MPRMYGLCRDISGSFPDPIPVQVPDLDAEKVNPDDPLSADLTVHCSLTCLLS